MDLFLCKNWLQFISSFSFRQAGEHISSFVQLRASVPAHWSQPMTAKPPITFELYDPYSRTSGNALIPICVLIFFFVYI